MVTYRAVFNCVKKLEEVMSVSDNTVSSLVVKKGIRNSTFRNYMEGDSAPGTLHLRKLASGMGIKAYD